MAQPCVSSGRPRLRGDAGARTGTLGTPLARRLLLTVLALLGCPFALLHAEEVFVTAMIGPTNGEIGACPPSCTTGSVSSAGSSAVSTAVPTPVIPAYARRARFGYTNDCAWIVTPTNITQTSSSGTWTFQGLPCLNWYKVYVTKGTSGSCSTNLLVTLTVDPATTLYDLSLNPVASLSLNQFQAAQPINVWLHVGYISNTTPNPTLAFAYASGYVSSSARWYMDAVRFETMTCWYPPTPARITQILYGDPITIAGTGPIEHLFVLVSSTNANQALDLWTREQSNTDHIGRFTFSLTPGAHQCRFFRVITQ
jgi:hypothetical protein